MYIRYFVPEDGDDQQHPNVFKVNKDSGVTLADIKKAFPIPGTFHFRFLRSVESFVVWMDVVDNDALVPVYNNCITIKASRMTSGGGNAPKARVVSQAPQLKTEPAPNVTATAVKTERQRLLSFDEHDHPPQSPAGVGASSQPFEPDLLGMTSPGTASAPEPIHADPFGFGDMASIPASTAPMKPVSISSPMMAAPMSQQSPVGMNSIPNGRPAMNSSPMGGGPMGGNRGPMSGGLMGSGYGGGRMPHPAQTKQQQAPASSRDNSMGFDPFSSFGNNSKK